MSFSIMRIGRARSNPLVSAERPDPPVHSVTKFPFIDALRGYAVLLVITSHAGGTLAGLPWPLKRVTDFGWQGVQLFFLMSCVTLLLSWRSDEAKGRADLTAFWTRRFFRIAPLYYFAAAAYYVIEPPGDGFNLSQILATFTFVNGWHPVLIPTVPGKWGAVPGSWSISVEFMFYAMFPLIAVLVRSMRRALLFVAIAIVAGSVINPIGYDAFFPAYGKAATENAIYFWFPNQMTVFALGTVLFHALRYLWEHPQSRAARLLRGRATLIGSGCVAACVAAAHVPFPYVLPPSPPLFIPTLLVASLIFMVFAAALGAGSPTVFVNAAIRSLGKVSFSAYLIHFGVLHELPARWPAVFDPHASGVRALWTFGALWIAAVAVTYGLSFVTYRTIEEPMIGVGRELILARRRRALERIPSLP